MIVINNCEFTLEESTAEESDTLNGAYDEYRLKYDEDVASY